MAPDSRTLRIHLVVVGLVVFVGALAAIDVRATYGARISVDEPQYLLTAISLAEDFDLDISDELADERYLPWHESPLLQQTIELDESGRRVSPHDPLLPVLLALPVKLGGWVGVRLAMAMMAGIAASLTVFTAVRRFGVSASTASLVVGGFFLSPPLISFGNQVYPAMAATICVVAGVAAVTGEVRRLWWIAAMAVVALPWLAVKYVPLAAVLAIALVFRLRAARRVLMSALVTLGLAGVVYLLFHRQVYGGWTVYASGDHFVDGEWQVVGTNVDLLGRSRRLVGLLVDQNFGLAAWAPAFLAAPAALTWMAVARRKHWSLLITLVVVGWAVATWVALTMHGWWWPGRQVVPVLPLVVIPIAAAVDGTRRWLAAVLVACLAAVVSWLWLVVEASTDRLTLIVDFMDTANPLYRGWRRLLPNHQSFELNSPGLTAAWTGLLVASCAVVGWRTRHSSPAEAEVAP
jgi:hypothetical protein